MLPSLSATNPCTQLSMSGCTADQSDIRFDPLQCVASQSLSSGASELLGKNSLRKVWIKISHEYALDEQHSSVGHGVSGWRSLLTGCTAFQGICMHLSGSSTEIVHEHPRGPWRIPMNISVWQSSLRARYFLFRGEVYSFREHAQAPTSCMELSYSACRGITKYVY